MKANKTPDASVDVSPSQRKLKQARLPFKLLSEVLPAPETPPSRKRKLSTPINETASKLGKISDENKSSEELIIVSDDDSNTAPTELKAHVKLPNPFVKLVDIAIKKKLQKSKATKKRKSIRKKHASNIVDVRPSVEDTKDRERERSVELMEVEDILQTNSKEDASTNSDSHKSIDKDDSVADIDLDSSEKIKGIDSAPKETHEVEDSENNIVKSTSSSPVSISITPKRNLRKRNGNADEKDKSLSSSNADVSINSDQNTPKHNRSSCVTNSQESLNGSTSGFLSPKQLQRKLESAKKKEDREKEKQDREKKKQQEKEEREALKREKEEQKKKRREEREEAKKREKEEKEEQRKKEKEEKDKQRELEKKLKEEKEELKKKEKEEKEEQRRKEKEARDEEKRKKQEALELEKQEQELKKKKAAEAFANFFVPKQKNEKEQAVIGPVIKNNMLSSFTKKLDMRLAPTVRIHLTDERKKHLENIIKNQNILENNLYLKCLKNGTTKPESSGKTWPLDDKDEDVMIIEDELPPLGGAGEVITCESTVREKLRPKLLSFHENRRPPYWGTWRKKSSAVKPRTPFGQDEKHLDYEVDSDEEWEEEQEGESIDGSAAGSDTEPMDDEYEVDNEVFVPHGYLSDEEATMDEEDAQSLSPEAQKARLKHLGDEFESEMKKTTEKLKPRLYGLIWETSSGGKPDKCADAIWNYFGKLSMIMDDPTPLFQPSTEVEEPKKKKKKVKPQAPESESDLKSPIAEKKRKPKSENKETKKVKVEVKKHAPEIKQNQRGINSFLTKLKSP